MAEETFDKLIIDKTDYIPMSKKEITEFRKLWLDFVETCKTNNINNKYLDFVVFVGKKLKEEKDDIIDEIKIF